MTPTKDKLELITIPAGKFIMGTDLNEAEIIEKPQHHVFLAQYSIARCPVTVAQFADFIHLSGYKPGAHWSDLHLKSDHPVIQVSWDDANAFCQWACHASGKKVRLPTEAEWEKAARGTDGRLYPWGELTPDPTLCNIEGKKGETTPVGSYSPQGDSPYGCADMLGNVWEWTSTIFRAYPYFPADGREDPFSREPRVLRGGAFWLKRNQVRCTLRTQCEPDQNYNFYSFRIVIES